MSEKVTGGPAFPCPHGWTGMGLRDYFAGQALHAAADAVCDDLSDPENRDGAAHAERHAKAAYMLADAMLKAREAK